MKIVKIGSYKYQYTDAEAEKLVKSGKAAYAGEKPKDDGKKDDGKKGKAD